MHDSTSPTPDRHTVAVADHDGVFWLEQVRTVAPVPAFMRARETDSEEAGLPRP